MPGTANTSSDTKEAWIKLKTPEITVIEEYLVYDLSGIVGSVGGSLGLYIGISLIDVFLFLVNRFTK